MPVQWIGRGVPQVLAPPDLLTSPPEIFLSVGASGMSDVTAKYKRREKVRRPVLFAVLTIFNGILS